MTSGAARKWSWYVSGYEDAVQTALRTARGPSARTAAVTPGPPARAAGASPLLSSCPPLSSGVCPGASHDYPGKVNVQVWTMSTLQKNFTLSAVYPSSMDSCHNGTPVQFNAVTQVNYPEWSPLLVDPDGTNPQYVGQAESSLGCMHTGPLVLSVQQGFNFDGSKDYLRWILGYPKDGSSSTLLTPDNTARFVQSRSNVPTTMHTTPTQQSSGHMATSVLFNQYPGEEGCKGMNGRCFSAEVVACIPKTDGTGCTGPMPNLPGAGATSAGVNEVGLLTWTVTHIENGQTVAETFVVLGSSTLPATLRSMGYTGEKSLRTLVGRGPNGLPDGDRVWEVLQRAEANPV